jgi:Tfp pilus assembly protein FimT
VRHAGATLVELAVVLVILGLLFGLSGLAITRSEREPTEPRIAALRQGRADAIRSGRAVRVSDSAGSVRFLPDGRALGPGVDPLTGEIVSAPR